MCGTVVPTLVLNMNEVPILCWILQKFALLMIMSAVIWKERMVLSVRKDYLGSSCIIVIVETLKLTTCWTLNHGFLNMNWTCVALLIDFLSVVAAVAFCTVGALFSVFNEENVPTLVPAMNHCFATSCEIIIYFLFFVSLNLLFYLFLTFLCTPSEHTF